MKLLKDKILIFLILTIVGLGYIMTTRGKWVTELEPKGNGGKELKISKKLGIQTEYFISSDSSILGSHSSLKIIDTCITLKDLSIKVSQGDNTSDYLLKTRTRISDTDNLEFDSLYNLIDSKIKDTTTVCSDKNMEMTSWFKYNPDKGDNFKIIYSLGNGSPVSIDLEKSQEFKVIGRHHYDYIILLYPVLWLVIALLIAIKIYQIVKGQRLVK